MAIFTNNGLILTATADQTNGASVAPLWVAIGIGCGTLASGLTNGALYTSLTLNSGIPADLANAQTLTLYDGSNTQTVTTSASVTAGATSIPVNSFTASANFLANVTGVAPTPQATDTLLYDEIARAAVATATAGASPGESLISTYFDGTQPTNLYLQVGYFGGAATSSLNSGTLMIADVQYWNHTINSDSATFQADITR